jgi:metallo-beta-lactamase family protein
MDEFAFALNDTLASRRGNVVIPAFAVGRTQDVLYFISRLQAEKRLPAMDVYVDSPMALAATRITLRYLALPEVERVHFVEDVEESKRLHAIGSGAVFISASGMCDGGRIRHHLRANLPRRECAIVFTGFQAAGTLGRRIVDGAKSVRLLGEACPVRSKVFTIGGLSAHADQSALLGWLSGFEQPPGQTWIVHGEPLAAQGLRAAIHQRLGWTAGVAAPLASCDFGTRTVAA